MIAIFSGVLKSFDLLNYYYHYLSTREIYTYSYDNINCRKGDILSMGNYELQADEVLLYEGDVMSNTAKGNLHLTLTSQRIVLEKEKGLFKKEQELVDIFLLDSIKYYNDAAQIKQKSSTVEIQTLDKNVIFTFSGMLEARKFTGKLVDAATGTTLAKRGSEKIKEAFNMVDDTLGFDTRGTIKSVLENGVKGTILNGIGKKK